MKVHGTLVFILKVDAKIVQASLISRKAWAEVALWRTSRSALKGWRFNLVRYGFRHTNPLFGCAMGVWL